MKIKTLLIGLTTFALAASTASADQLGGYLFGVQYQKTGGLRYGLGLPLVAVFGGSTSLNVSGDISYLVPLKGQQGLDPYYGFGLGAGINVANGGGGFNLYPNVLVGLNFRNTTAFTPFVEGSVGPDIRFGNTTGVQIGYGIRLGVNYRL
jgi:hypothetical protein